MSACKGISLLPHVWLKKHVGGEMYKVTQGDFDHGVILITAANNENVAQ